MRTAKTLIRLGGCLGWSESSLGAHAILLVLSWGGSVMVVELHLVHQQMARVKQICTYRLCEREGSGEPALRAVSSEPPLLAHTSIESRGTVRHKARSLAPLNGWACAVKICHDGILEDTNSLDGAQIWVLTLYHVYGLANGGNTTMAIENDGNKVACSFTSFFQ